MKGKFDIKKRLAAIPVLAAACLSLTGCFESEVYKPRVPMLFSSYAASKSDQILATRADDSFIPAGTTTLPDGSSFGVFAWYQEGVIGSGDPAEWSDGGWSPSFMFNQRVDFDGTNYSYSPLRYWPSNTENTISFWAYYPYSVYSEANTGAVQFYEDAACTRAYVKGSTTGLPVVKCTVPTNPANQYDLLFDSFTQKDKTYSNCSPVEGVVPFTFCHAFCLVEFEIIEGTGAVIDSLKLSNLYWNGVCTDVKNLTWASQGGLEDFSIANVSVESSTICRLLMVPQDLTVSNPTLTIKYDITFASSDPNHSAPIVYRGNRGTVALTAAKNEDGVSSAGITSWESGRHYIYKIRAGFERIEFEEVIESTDDWIIGNGNISVPE